MNSIVLISGLAIGLIIGGSVVLLVGIFILLHFTLFASLRYKKQVGDLLYRFEFLHTSLTGKLSQYLRRIETIAQTNLLFATTHTTLSKRFKDIRDKSDPHAQLAVNKVRNLLSDRDYQELKAELPKAKITIANYEEEVNALEKDLLVVIQPEEECKMLSLRLKDELRKIKQDYFVKQADLTLVGDSFDEVFRRLDDEFRNFEEEVESAHYDEAKAILPNISAVIKELGRCLQELPSICITISSVIPDKIASLQNRFDEMKRAEFPLHHLFVVKNIEDMERSLEGLTARVRSFDLRGVREELDAIIARIDEYFDLFDKEKEARLLFESECEGIYNESAAIEMKYIRMCNALPEVRTVYVISGEAQLKIDTIKNLINIAGATKRSLDTCIHSGSKQPYSILVERMQALRDESESARAAIDDFDAYLLRLKSDTEQAMEDIDAFYGKLHLCEVALDKIALPVLMEKYGPAIENCYDLIDEIYSTISVLPIDVEDVNAKIGKLHEIGTPLCEQVLGDYDNSLLADSAIVFANRDRYHLAEIRDALNQAETFYFSGEFQRAYEVTSATLKRTRGE